MIKKIDANITKVVRSAGKEEATMAVEIPMDEATQVPLGKVIITIEAVQGSIFDEEEDRDSTAGVRAGKRSGAKMRG